MPDLQHFFVLDETPFLAEINWQRPWLDVIRETAGRIGRGNAWREALNAAAHDLGLRNHRGKPIHFVPQASLPPSTAYEAFISATGGVPTRENLHDFFNALVWITFPRIKVQLNALQAAELARTVAQNDASGPKLRGKVRDAATLFDENAALLIVKDHRILDDLRSHQWKDAFLTSREIFWRGCEVWLFGHALMEKLVRPYKAITAHAWPVLAEASFFTLPQASKISWIDETVAQQLSRGLSTAGFTPLPVLGVPGWWDGQDENFYSDTSVFRPSRRAVL